MSNIKDKSIILCLETSTNVCSVCLSKDGVVISIRETSDFKSHTEKITIFIQECLDEAKIAFTDINAIAISSGPGSYTGLRIGASTAKGLCFGLNIPLIAINSLEALLQAIGPLDNQDDIKLANIDARRKEVYGMIADFNGTQTETESIILDEENILSLKYSDKQIHLAGNGSDKCQELLTQKTVIHALQSSSKFMVKLAFEKYIAQNFNDITRFSPYYHKNPNITLSKKRPF